jgi:hypothetical protein
MNHAWMLAAAFALAGSAAAAAPNVDVTFIQPERFTDATLNGAYGAKARETALREIAAHLQRLGTRHLTPEQRLTIEVLDIDLAGQYEPWRAPGAGYHLRYLRGATWPRIKLRYRLEEAERPVLAGEETVVDPAYDLRPLVRSAAEQLPHEKAMLEDWFRNRIIERRPVRS